MRILVIFGTRPEAIKMAPVVKALRSNPTMTVRVCVTAQHRGLLDQVLNLFEIRPEYDLDIMASNQTLSDITVEILSKMVGVLCDFRPDMLLVQGDTTSSFAAALIGFYQKVDVAHVEAGLRTGDRNFPWPEEINRKLISTLACLHFAPTAVARQNLLNEGVEESAIAVTGNTVIDTLLDANAKLEANARFRQSIASQFGYLREDARIILVTGHRRENFGVGIERVCNALAAIAHAHNVQILYPVHPNPNVQEPVSRILGGVRNVHLIDPLDYLSFVYLMNRSYLIVTDSGGIQEEAPAIGKPVLVTRDVTERPEAIAAGSVRLVGTDSKVIGEAITTLLSDQVAYARMSIKSSPYGDGHASERIASILAERSRSESVRAGT